MRRTLLVVLGLVVAACGGETRPDAAGEPAPPGAVIPSAASPPGTDLGDGFTVPEGTTLIGDPVPAGVAYHLNEVPVMDDGWVATSLVDGRPRAIIENYLGQAVALGLAERHGPGCHHDRTVLRCVGTARSSDPAAPRSVSVEVVRGENDDVVSNHAVVQYSTVDIYWESAGFDVDDDPTASRPPPTMLPLPAVGESIGTGGETWAEVLVQDGSRVAAPAHVHLDDATGGVAIILEVTGDARTVLDRYLTHLVSFGFEASEPEVRTAGEAVLTTAHAGESGGDGFVLSMVERPRRPTWLRITGSHD